MAKSSLIFQSDGSIESIASRMPGQHNIECGCIIAVALLLGKINAITNGVSTFKGVKREFEWIVDGPKVYIDDYTSSHRIEDGHWCRKNDVSG